MASGTLPLGTYHRTKSLGSGSYGSVITVYDDDGAEFALKLFDEEDEEDEEVGLSLGALREVSILRLLRHKNAHPNIISIHDVQTGYSDDGDEAGAGTSGCLSMAMPLFPEGSIMDALESSKINKKADKVRIAHGLLSAVAHLHENSIIHRDIKSDNLLLKYDDDGCLQPVLIDFSLAKIVDPSIVIPGGEKMRLEVDAESEMTHTPSVGTPTYRAPEVIDEEPYSFPSDLWSVGVCLLEMLRGRELEVQKDKGAVPLIQGFLKELPEGQPFPDLIRGLLETDPSKRLTARQALESSAFKKFNLHVHPKTYQRFNMKAALPFENTEDGTQGMEEQKENSLPAKANATKQTPKSKKNKVNPILSKRFQRIQKICRAMEWTNPMTAQAALTYTSQMSELCEVDDPDDTQALLDCVILAHKFFEFEITDLTDLVDAHQLFENWDIDEYQDNEGTIFMLLDFCLYPRQFISV